METRCLRDCPKLPLWIIEHLWAHKMIQEVLDVSLCLDVDSQPLSLEDSWRLRVASAQVFSIMKNRSFQQFDRVVTFLEATHRLLPRLVSPIKHMKIVFGLKTMVIMWMLREGRGMIDIVFKTIQFFPNKLPQYQDQCSQHEMFLMRKNQLDFKVLAQTLAMDKRKLEDYMKSQMEQQYGESYGQKVEERLLLYLQQLEAVLPTDTYIDQIMKKTCPVTEEEKMLLDVVTSDSVTITTTLQNLLHCDVASCRPVTASQKSENREGMENSVLSTSSLKTGVSSQVSRENESKESLDGGEGERNKAGMSARDGGNSSEAKVGQEERGKEKEEVSCGSVPSGSGEVVSSPQFCSRHQRWVRSILQECPDEVSENTTSSPTLFPSSSSTSSSQDLTPSGLIAGPPDQRDPPPAASEHRNPEAELRSRPSGPSGSESEPLPQPSSSRQTLLSPVVRLIDICSVRGIYSSFKLQEASLNHSNTPRKDQAASRSHPQVLNSSYHLKSDNKVSRFTLTPTNSPNATVSPPSRTIPSICSRIPSSTDPSGPGVPQDSIRPGPGVSCSLSDCQLRFFLRNQPSVSLTRLNAQECHRLTDGRSSIRDLPPVEDSFCYHDNEEEDPNSSFDPNILYSSHSSSSNEDSPCSDLDYKPSIKKKRRLSENMNSVDLLPILNLQNSSSC